MNVNEQARKALSMIDAFIVQYKKDLNEIGQIPTLQGFKAEMYARVKMLGFPIPIASVMIDRYAQLNGEDYYIEDDGRVFQVATEIK